MAAHEAYSLFEPGSYRRLLSYWVVTFLIVLAVSLISDPGIQRAMFLVDTLLHILLYSILSFIQMVFFRCRKTTFLLAISMAPLGYLLENIHAVITGDPFNAITVLANNAGVLAGIATGFIVRLKSHYKREGNQ
jgi:hypothetical protein